MGKLNLCLYDGRETKIGDATVIVGFEPILVQAVEKGTVGYGSIAIHYGRDVKEISAQQLWELLRGENLQT
jgi:hypothetical protein